MEQESTRYPAVAGQFYSADPEELRQQIQGCYRHPLGPGEAPGPVSASLQGVVGFVVPHAGYDYSGPVAAHAFRRMGELGYPQVAVVLGPSAAGFIHMGMVAYSFGPNEGGHSAW
jgi:AmmeMemoRadiSam system protein B